MTKRGSSGGVLVLAAVLAGCAAAPATPAPTPASTAPAVAGQAPAGSTAAPTATASERQPAASGSESAGAGGPGGSPAIAQLALENVGKTAGTCAQDPMRNSLGGTAFEHSCVGWNGVPEYWCADFVIWTWRNSGYDVKGLTAASISFRSYGVKRGSLQKTPRPGDAVVFNKTMSTTYGAHVGVVTQVRDDGSVVLANGDWGGQKGSEVTFATTASVKETVVPADLARVGAGPIDSMGGLRVTAIVGPVQASKARAKATTRG